MSQADWEMNAANVALAGMGSVGGESALSPLSLTVFTEYGVVETAPFYIADKSNPKVVFIRVGMKKNSLITNGSLSDIQKITEKQLAEGGYSVKTREIDEVEDGYWLTFAIRP